MITFILGGIALVWLFGLWGALIIACGIAIGIPWLIAIGGYLVLYVMMKVMVD